MDKEDKFALYTIKHKFGGSIKEISSCLKYKLAHKYGLIKLVSSVNGLIRNPTIMLQLDKVCKLYGIEFEVSKPLTYYNGWFSGFIDSDGSIYYNEKLDQLILSVTQKNKYLLDPLIKLYNCIRLQISKKISRYFYKNLDFSKDTKLHLKIYSFHLTLFLSGPKYTSNFQISKNLIQKSRMMMHFMLILIRKDLILFLLIFQI